METVAKALSVNGFLLEALTTVGICVLVVAAIGALILFGRAVARSQPVVESFTTSPLLEQRGWTSGVIAQRLIDRSRDLAEAVQIARDPVEYLRPSEQRDYVQIKGGGIEVSFQSVVRATRELLRISEVKISGEMTVTGTAASEGQRRVQLAVRVERTESGFWPRLWARLRFRTKGYRHFHRDREDWDKKWKPAPRLFARRYNRVLLFDGLVSQVDTIVARAAEGIFETVDAYAAAARVMTNDIEKCERLIDRILRSEGSRERGWAHTLRGIRAWRDRRLGEAQRNLELALGDDPTNITALLNMAGVQLDRRDYDASLLFCKQALRVQPSNANTHCQMAHVYEGLSDIPQALDCCERALKIDPRLARAYAIRGRLRARIDKLSEAERDFQQCVALRPDYAWGWRAWGQAYGRYAQRRAGLEKLERAAELDPTVGDSFVAWASLLWASGDRLAATAKLEAAVNADPTNYWALRTWGRYAEPPRPPAKTAQAFEKALAAEGGKADTLSDWGWWLIDQGRPEQSVEKFEQATQIDPMSEGAWRGWSNALRRMRREKRAQDKIRRALEIDPRSTAAWVEKGRIHLSAGPSPECTRLAIECFRQATEVFKSNVEAWVALGAVQRDNGQYDEAVKSFESARNIDPEASGPLIELGHLLLQKNPSDAQQRIEAREQFEQAVLVDRWNPWALRALCDWHRRFGKIEDAIACVDRAPLVVQSSFPVFLALAELEVQQKQGVAATARFIAAANANPWFDWFWRTWLNAVKPGEEAAALIRVVSGLPPQAHAFATKAMAGHKKYHLIEAETEPTA